jgi:putative ABC transport system permease protein
MFKFLFDIDTWQEVSDSLTKNKIRTIITMIGVWWGILLLIGLLLGIGILEAYGPSLDKYFITDPSVSTFLVAMATLALIISGFIAAYLPAKRASQIKPIIALRDE